MSVHCFVDSVLRDRQVYPDPLNWTLDANQVKTWARTTKEIKAISASPHKSPLDYVSTVQILSIQIPFPKPELFAQVLTAVSISATDDLVFASPHGLVDGDRVWTSSNNGAPYGVPVDLPLYVVNSTPTTIQISTSSGGSSISLSPATLISLGFAVYTAEVQAKYEDAKIVLTTPFLFFTMRCKSLKDNRNVRCLDGTHATVTHVLTRGGVTQGKDGAPAFLEWNSRAEQTMRWALNDVIEFAFETRDGSKLDVFKESKEDLMIDADPTRQMMVSFIVTPFIRDGTYSNQFVDVYDG